MSTVRKRAKHGKSYSEDPVYNNSNYVFDWKIVGKNISRRRLELGMTQQDLSDLTGIPTMMISQFENNTNGKHPSNKHLVILMHALNIDANTIYSGNIDPELSTITDKYIIELMSSIKSELYNSNLYKDALEYRKKFKPKSLGKIDSDAGYSSQRDVAERDFDFNRKNFSF